MAWREVRRSGDQDSVSEMPTVRPLSAIRIHSDKPGDVVGTGCGATTPNYHTCTKATDRRERRQRSGFGLRTPCDQRVRAAMDLAGSTCYREHRTVDRCSR